MDHKTGRKAKGKQSSSSQADEVSADQQPLELPSRASGRRPRVVSSVERRTSNIRDSSDPTLGSSSNRRVFSANPVNLCSTPGNQPRAPQNNSSENPSQSEYSDSRQQSQQYQHPQQSQQSYQPSFQNALVNPPQYSTYYPPVPVPFNYTNNQGQFVPNPYYYSWPYYYQVNNQYNQFNQYSSVPYDPYYISWQQGPRKSLPELSSSQPIPTRFLSVSSDHHLHFPRGPPKKPSQSGHALWVGNLPNNTQLSELCALFGTKEILSIFLIEKTKCAFVNYKSASAVKEGISEFQTRGGKLRGNTLLVKPRDTAQTQNQQDSSTSASASSSSTPSVKLLDLPNKEAEQPEQAVTDDDRSDKPKDRYFICKSLTVEDLRASISLGIWSTQSHNERPFNEAFKTCDNVYIFFSANRARNFHGYARMESEIPDSPPDLLPQSSSPFSFSQISHPNTVETKADPSIPLPPGRIVDDSSRGCLFWEAIPETDDGNPGTSSVSTRNNWTSPFKIRWMSPFGRTLPFDKTMHLLNPLNENKPVKIARDGTEVSYEIGKKMTQMFHD